MRMLYMDPVITLLNKWGMLDNPYCDCGPNNQSIPHIVNDCLRRAFPDCLTTKDDAKNWLKNLDVSI